MRSIPTCFAMVLTASLMLGVGAGPVFAAPGAAAEPIVVVAVRGKVNVSSDGAMRPVRPGSVIEPPATIITERDSHLELRQGATTASIAGDTRIELRAQAGADGLIERVRQPRGNVVYDVARRPGRKLRIETPYLVAVVKGTRFNVAAQYESTTVSLFEGQLEIWTADDSDVVQLDAGEIATRSRNDSRIRVLRMDTGDSIRARNASPGEATDARSSNATTRGVESEPRTEAEQPAVVAIDNEDRDTPTTTAASATVKLDVQAAAEVSDVTKLGVDDPKTGADIDAITRAAQAEVGLDAALAGTDAAAVGVATGTAVDLASPSIDVAAASDLDLGTAVTTDTTATTVIEPTRVQSDVGAQVDVASTPIAVDAGVEVEGTTAIDAGVAAGPLTVDLGVGADATTGAPAVDLDAAMDESARPDAPLPAIVEVVVAPLRGLLGP